MLSPPIKTILQDNHVTNTLRLYLKNKQVTVFFVLTSYLLNIDAFSEGFDVNR